MDKDLLYQQFLSNGGDASYEEFQALQSQFVIDSPDEDLKKKDQPTENGNPSLTNGTPPSQTDLPTMPNPIPDSQFNVPLGSEQDLSSPSSDITAEMPSTDLPSTATVSSGTENSNVTLPKDNYRNDGSLKGKGFLGALKGIDGKDVTEYSIGVELNGKEIDIPTVIPTLTQEELDYVLNQGDMAIGIPIADKIAIKAEKYAKERLAKGLPVFATKEEEGKFSIQNNTNLPTVTQPALSNVGDTVLPTIQKPKTPLDVLAGKSNDTQGEADPTEGFKTFNTTSEFKRYKDGNEAVINGSKQTNPYYGLKQLEGNFSVSVGEGTPNEKIKTLGSDVNGVFEDSTGKKVVDINGNLYDLDDYLNPERDFVESENNQLFNTNGVILTKNQKESDEGKPNVIDDLYEFKPIELNTKTFNINNGDPSIVEKQNADLLQLEKEGKIKVYKNEKTDENGNLSWEITNPNFLKEYNDYNAKIYTPSDIDKGYNYAIQRNKILDPILQGARFENEAEDRFKEKFGVNAFNRYGVIPDSEMEQINDSLQKEQLLSQGYSEDQAIQFINQEKTNSRQQEVKKGYDFIDNIVKPQLEIRASTMPDATSTAQRSEVEVDEHYQALRQLALNLPEKFNEFAESHKDWDFKKPEMLSAFKNAFIEYVKEDKAYQYAFNDYKIQQANLDVKKGAVNKDVIKVKESREKVNKYSAQLEEQSQYFSQVSELKNEIDSNYFKSESEKTRKDREENRGYRENEAGAIATTTLKRLGDIPFRITGDWMTTGAALFGASDSTIKDLEIESKPFVGTRQQGITDDVVEYTDDKGNKYEAVNGTDLFYIDKNGQRGIATNDSDINSFIAGNKLKETNRYKDFNGANFLAEVSKVTADMAVGGGIGKGVGKGVIRTLTKLKAGLSETNYARKGLDMLIASAANPNTTTSYAMAIQYYGGSYKNYQEKGYTNGEARALAIFSTAALANVNRIFPDIKLFQESDQIALNTYRLLASGETSAAKKLLVGKFSEASKRIGGNVIGEVPEETIYEPIAESIVQYMGASISGDRKKMQNIDSSIDFSADTVGLTIGTVLLAGAFGTGKGNINFNQSTPLEKSIFLSKNPEYIETLHNLKNDAIVGESAKRELSAYYTIEKFVDKIPSGNNLNVSQTAEVVVKLQKIDALKKEIDKSDIEAFKTDIQGKIDVLNADISTILEQSKTQQTPNNESPNAETAQPTPQSETVQEQTTETEQSQVATESEQPTITGEQDIPSELNPTQDGQTTAEIQSPTAEAEENVQSSVEEGRDAANQLPEMGQGIAQSENVTQEVAPEEEINEDDIVLADDTLDLINSLTDETAPSDNIGTDGSVEPAISSVQQDQQGGQENPQGISPTADTGTGEGNAEVTTDAREIQELKNAIQEGESILKSGKNSQGKKLTEGQKESIKKSIDNAKRRLGVQQTPAFSDNEQAQTLNENQLITTPDGKSFYQKEDGNWYGTNAKGGESKVTRKNRITELDNLNKEKNVTLTKEKNGFTYKKYKDGSEEIVSSKGKIITSKIERRRNGKLRIENNPQFTTQRAKIFGEMTDNQIKIEERKRTKEALRNFIPSNVNEVAMLYFANGGKITSEEISGRVLGNSEELESRGFKKRPLTDYKWAFLGKDAKTFDDAQMAIREDYPYFDEQDITNALADVIQTYSSSTDIAEEITNKYNSSVDPYFGFTEADAVAMQEAELNNEQLNLLNSVEDNNSDISDEELLDYYKNQYENSIQNLTKEQQDEIYKSTEANSEGSSQQSNQTSGNEVSNSNIQTSPEYKSLISQRDSAEKEVASKKAKLDSVSKNTNKDFQADQENLFEERPTQEGMFDERADGNAGKEVIATAKREYDQAKAELYRLNNSIRDFESGKVSGTQAIDFQSTDKQFTPITQKAYNALVKKLSSVFKKFGANVITDIKTLQEKLKEFRNVDFKIIADNPDNAFEKWSDGYDLLEDYNVQDAKTGEKLIVKGYHGTTNNFNVFDSEVKGNIEGHLGKVNYFTTDESDASGNYLSDGADITGRIDRRQDELEDGLRYDYQNDENGLNFQEIINDFNISDNEIQQLYPNGKPEFVQSEEISRFLAEKELKGGEEKVLDLYLKLNNPVVLGKPSYFENISEESIKNYKEDAISEIADEYGISEEDAESEYGFEVIQRASELSGENPIYDALTEALDKNGYDGSLSSEILQDIYDSEVDLNEIEKSIRGFDLFDNSEGELAQSQVIADFFKNLGFDAIILTDVNDRFKNMGLSNTTSHIHIFNEFNNQIKLADGSNVEFSDSSDIRYMKTANGEIYGAKFPDGTIYLNPDKVNANTPIHEFSHLWQQLMPARFKQGVELLKNTPIGKKTFAELKANEGYANKSDEELWNETMVTVMGNEGERIFNSSRTSKLKEWLTDLFKALGNAFGIRDLSPNDKLSTFVKGALSEVMGTKEIIPESSVEQKEVPIYIKKMSNTDLRGMLDKLGLVMDAVCP